MGDFQLKMIGNVRIFGLCCWFKVFMAVIMGLSIFVATTADAQRFNNGRNMGNFAPNRPGTRNFQSPRNNQQSFWNEHQQMLQELERKIQEQRQLANDIAKQQEELRRLQNINRNFAPQKGNTRTLSNTTSAIENPNGSHLNNNNRNGVLNRAITNSGQSFAANHFRQTSQRRNKFNNGNNLRQRSGRNIQRNDNDNLRPKVNSNANRFGGVSSQNQWDSKTNNNNNMWVTNRQNNAFRPAFNTNSANKVNSRHRTEVPFRHTPRKNINAHSRSSPNVMIQTKSGRSNIHAVKGIPIQFNVHHTINNMNNTGNRNRNQNHNVQTSEIKRRKDNFMNKIKERKRNWQPVGNWQRKDKDIVQSSNTNGFLNNRKNNRKIHQNLRNTLRTSFVKPLSAAPNKALGHEEISVFPQHVPTLDVRESIQFPNTRSFAGSMPLRQTAAQNPHMNSRNRNPNHQNPHTSPTWRNRATNVTSDVRHFDKRVKPNQPDTAIVIRYRDGQVQIGTDEFVKVRNDNIRGMVESKSQKDKFGNAQGVKNTMPYFPVWNQQSAIVDNKPVVATRPNVQLWDKFASRNQNTSLSNFNSNVHDSQNNTYKAAMPLLLSHNNTAYVTPIVETNHRISSLHHMSSKGTLPVPNQSQPPLVINKQRGVSQAIVSQKESSESTNSGGSQVTQQYATDIHNAGSQFRYSPKATSLHGSGASAVSQSVQQNYVITNGQRTQPSMIESNLFDANMRLQQPQNIQSKRQHVASQQTNGSPQVVQVHTSMSQRNHQVPQRQNVRPLYLNKQQVHQTSVQRNMASSQVVQRPTHWAHQEIGHVTEQGRAAPTIVQTKPLSHDQWVQPSTAQQHVTLNNNQMPVSVNRQPSVSQVIQIPTTPVEQQNQQAAPKRSIPHQVLHANAYTRKDVYAATVPQPTYLNNQDVPAATTHAQTYSTGQNMHSEAAAQLPEMTEVVNVNVVANQQPLQTAQTASNNVNDHSPVLKQTTQNNQHLLPSPYADPGTQIRTPTIPTNQQDIRQTGKTAQDASLQVANQTQNQSLSDTQQILKTLLAVLQGTNAQKAATLDNTPVVQTVNVGPPNARVDTSVHAYAPPNQPPVVQTVQPEIQNVQTPAQFPVVSNIQRIIPTLTAVQRGTNQEASVAKSASLTNQQLLQTLQAAISQVSNVKPAIVQTIDSSNAVPQNIQTSQADTSHLNVQTPANIAQVAPISSVVGSNLNVAQYPNVQSMAYGASPFHSPFGHQMENFGMGNLGMGNMWGMGMHNPAVQAQMWQQLMLGGDSIDIPDPPDPTPTVMAPTPTVMASTSSVAASQQTPVSGMAGPPKIEVEVEGAPPVPTTTETTTTTTTTTTIATTSTVKPKPKPKPKVAAKVASNKKSNSDIINSIALKLAALLGKPQGLSLTQHNVVGAAAKVRNKVSNVVNRNTLEPKAKTMANPVVNVVKTVPQTETVNSKTIKINTNYAKPVKAKTVEIDNAQPLQLPVTFLSGKVPKKRKTVQTLVNTADLNVINPEVEPVLAGVDVKKANAEQIGAGPEIVKTDHINLNMFGSLKDFQPTHTPQPVVDVKPDKLIDITNVLTGKNILDGIVSVGSAANVKSDPGTHGQVIQTNNVDPLVMDNLKNILDAKKVTTITTVSPLVVNYQNVAPAPSVTSVNAPSKNNDTTAFIKTAVVDLLSQIKQLWMNSDLSTSSITTTQKPCTPDSPDYSCEGIGMFASVKTIGNWCVDKCRAGACVESVCKCSCPSPALGVAGWQGGTTESALGSLDRANTTDIPEEIERFPDKRTPAQHRRARKYAHLCHPMAMIHNRVCGVGPNDQKCPTGAKCMIIPAGENFCCWQDRELPGPTPQKPRRRRKGQLRRKWRRRPRHKRMSTPVMSTLQPSEEEEEVEQEDMVTTTAAMTTTAQFTTESPLTSTFPYYDVFEPMTTTISLADVKLSAYDVNKHADFKYDPSADYVLTTPGFAKDSFKYKDEISPDKIHWGSDLKGRIKDKPRKDPVGPTSGYDVLGVNPDTLGFVPDIERSRWGRRKDSGAGTKSSGWNEPDDDDECTCTTKRKSPPSWNRRDGGWRDPPRADWRDPPRRDPPHRDPYPRDPPPREGWRDSGRHYDRWRDPPPPTDRPWGRSSRWRDAPPTREHGPPQRWGPGDRWASRDRGGRRGFGLRNRWRETTTKANEEEAAEANDK